MRFILKLASLLAAATAAAVADDAPPPRLDVKSAYLVDYASGRVLAESAADERLEPASLTKLMTAYVVFGALEEGRIGLDDEVTISERAWRMGGTRMFIEVGSKVRVEELIHGLLIQSGNDAAVALAEHVAGSVTAFAALMNAHAAALGMDSSQFRNPSGLPAREHFTTARDLAVLAAALIRDFPERYAVLGEREYTYNAITQQNRNELLFSDPTVDGLKTGHTNAAGYCIVTSAERDGMRLIAVIMGATTAAQRNRGARALLDYGFEHYETHKLYAGGVELGIARVRGGSPGTASLGLARDLFVTIPRGSYPGLAASMKLATELAPPLPAGEAVGEVSVALGGSPLLSVPVVALEDVAEGGIWSLMVDGVGGWLD